MRLRNIVGVLLVAVAGVALAAGNGSAENFAGGGGDDDGCGSDLIVSSLSMTAAVLTAGVENPTQQLGSGYFLPGFSIGGESYLLAIPLQLDALDAVDVTIVFPEPYALTSFAMSACEGHGITEGPDPLEVHVIPRNGEQSEGEDEEE